MDKRSNFERLRNKLKTDLFKNEGTQTKINDEIISQCPQTLEYVQCSSYSEFKEEQPKISEYIQKQKQLKNMKESFQNQYQIGKILGEGAHAVVRQCWQISNPEETYAVKITRSPDPEIMDIMKQTFLNTVQLNHKNICKTNMLYIDPNMECSYLVMEYLPYPSLQQLLKEKQILSLQETVKIIRQLLEAITYIHQLGLCHRDIKPDNIIVDTDEKIVKLIDFGVSKRFLTSNKSFKDFKNNLMWTVTGTMPYQAPELWCGSGYKQSIDIWAIGVVCYQMLCGKLPVNQEIQMEYFSSQEEYTGHFQDNNFIKLPIIVKDFIKRLLQWNPEKRISGAQALLHPWLYEAINKSYNQIRSKDDIDLYQQDKPQLGVVRSMQANQKIFQFSVALNINDHFIDKKDLTTNGQIIIGYKDTSQQIRDRSIHFQQSITSMNLTKPKTQNEDVKDFLEVINYCDSNSSFESLEEKQTSQISQSKIQPNTKNGLSQKLGVIKEEPITPNANSQSIKKIYQI